MSQTYTKIMLDFLYTAVKGLMPPFTGFPVFAMTPWSEQLFKAWKQFLQLLVTEKSLVYTD